MSVASRIVAGEVCELCCCELFGAPRGYPTTCRECAQPEVPAAPVVHTKVRCPTCGKRVKPTGLPAHTRDVHSART